MKRAGCLAALAIAALAAPALARAATGLPAAHHAGPRGVQVQGATQGRGTDALGGTTRAATIPGHLINHGGPVMATNVVHAMYWFPSGYTIDSSWRDAVDGYLGAVADDSGKTSNVFSVTPQYGVAYDAQFAGSAVDTRPFPANGCHAGVAGKPCLSEEQIFDELDAFAQAQGWTADANDIAGAAAEPSSHPTHFFAVYLPKGVADCYDESAGACSANSSKSYYCAYHTAWYDDNQTFVWANLPWSWDTSGCQASVFPNNKTSDTAIDVTSHEYIEALTDPFLNAWYDVGGYEIADKCQTTYGTALSSLVRNYNQLVGDGHYWTQLEYSNALGYCYQLGKPVVSAVAPTAAVAGQTVDITGENFFGPVVVRFNGIVAGVQSVSPTSISVRVPAGQVFGDVTVQAIGGTGTSSTVFGFEVPRVNTLSAVDGRAGNEVTITGTRFRDVTSVKFGSFADTTFAVVDDSTITAHVPAGFSAGRVTVASPSGGSVSPQTFAVTKVTALSPLNARAGATVTITGQGLGSASSVDFPNHPAVSVARATAGYVKAVVPADATYGPLVVHTPNIDAAGLPTKTFRAAPTIASFTPDGEVASTVTIAGANLGDATAVRFGSVAATFAADASGTSISATTPAGVSSARIIVVTPHGSVLTPTVFQITKVTTLSPASGVAGSTVAIIGQGLKSTTAVDFPGARGVAVVSATASVVRVRVPAGATPGALTVHTPNIGGAGVTAPRAFKPLPRVASFDAGNYQVGDLVTAHGTNLLATGGYTARLGVVTVDDLTIADAQTMTFRVPAGAVSGSLTFANASGTTVSAARVLVRPTVDGFTPADATAGERVTLTGATFNGTTAVTFGGVRAAFSVARGGGSLVAVVPPAAVDGAVAVTNAGGTTSSLDAFHVDPVIRGFTPASGPVGATVLVSGTGLKSVAQVDFGGVSATPTETSATWLKVVVPPGATSGAIGVHSGAMVATAGHSFAVTFSVTGFSQPYGAPGKTITLNGIGLTAVTGVKFGSLPASIVSQAGSSLSVVVPAITGDTSVSVTKGRTTIDAPAQFGLFAVTSASPHALAPGGTLQLTGSHLGGATATFAGAASPASVANDGSATVPGGFTGGTVTITDPYGDSVDESIPLFAVESYSPAHAGPGEQVTIQLAAGGDYSTAASVQVKFDGVAVAATGGDGTVSATVPDGATSGALQVEADASGWATGPAFTVDRAAVELQSVQPGHVTLKVTSAGGVGDTMVTWRQDGTTQTVDLPAGEAAAGDTIDVDTGFTLGELTIEVGTPLAVEDGIALGMGGTPSAGFVDDVAALHADGVWGSTDAFDWSALAGGQSVARVGESSPDDVPDWGIS